MFTVSPAPHAKGPLSTKRLMRDVIIALIPAFLVSLYMFGLSALFITLVSIASCVFFEWTIQKFVMKIPPAISDSSAILTGLLLAFNLPSNLPVWMVIMGSLVAIGVGKMSFGGLGNNIFNPALAGRVFLLISCPAAMTTWPKPLMTRDMWPWQIVDGVSGASADAFTGATPLVWMKMGNVSELNAMDMLVGKMGGSLGEISAVALLIGFAYLLVRQVITWHIPISILATVAVFTGILHVADPAHYASPVFHLLAGGLMLGAIFMATDYVTSPMHPKGMLVYGAGIGVITVVIRCFGSYPEGMSFAILIMNAVTPLINRYMKPKRFGAVAKAK
ncbi:MAG: RnfABCDGE type electron transport complex subunit D [Prevotellaceae bacterium]|jgi:electron transport complex protein RnfD|nr:RnfABCDGE type electron transport complex subunit D [Prevotellaceae bacterium]